MTRRNITLNESLQDRSYHQKFEQEFLAFAATELICSLMKQKGMNKATLATKIGKSKAFVTQLLSGSRNMTLHTFADLAFALDHKVNLTLLDLNEPAAQHCHQIRVHSLKYVNKPDEGRAKVRVPQITWLPPVDTCYTDVWNNPQYAAG
jgi:antitoxin component HigA of HigAB toxin-antitoxin module